jgi:hypothetical protein
MNNLKKKIRSFKKELFFDFILYTIIQRKSLYRKEAQ